MFDFAANAAANALGSLVADRILSTYDPMRIWENSKTERVDRARKLVEAEIRGSSVFLEMLDSDDEGRFALLHFLAQDLGPILDAVICAVAADSLGAVRSHLIESIAERLGRFSYAARPRVEAQATELFGQVANAAVILIDALPTSPPDSVRQRGQASAVLRHLDRIAQLLNSILAEVSSEEYGSIGSIIAAIKVRGAGLFHGIPLPDLLAPKVVDMLSVFVEPTLVDSSGSRVTISALDRLRGRYVILGNPGAGKSTLARRLALSASGSLTMPAPVFLPLRLAEDRLSRSTSVAGLVIEHLANVYDLRLPPTVLERLMQEGQLLVMLDGIDEISSLEAKLGLNGQLAVHAALYPESPLICTARLQGFDYGLVKDGRLEPLILQDLSGAQVRNYAEKWFSFSGTGERADQFIVDSEDVADIRSNPLMLALMCLLYSASQTIPDTRAALYARCADLLYREWDRHRRIEIGAEFDAFLNEALEELAFGFFCSAEEATDGLPYPSDTTSLASRLTSAAKGDHLEIASASEGPDLQRVELFEIVDGARLADPESVVAARVKTYLHEWHLADSITAFKVASGFIEFCKGRLWILTEMGRLEGSGEPLIGFIHKTFLEYYCGVRIARTFTFEEMLELLRIGAGKASFRTVLEVAVQVRERAARGSGSQLFAHHVEYFVSADALVSDSLSGLDLLVSSLSIKPTALRCLTELLKGLPKMDPIWPHIVGIAAMARADNQEVLIEVLIESMMEIKFSPDQSQSPIFLSVRVTEEQVVEAAEIRGSISDVVRFTGLVRAFQRRLSLRQQLLTEEVHLAWEASRVDLGEPLPLPDRGSLLDLPSAVESMLYAGSGSVQRVVNELGFWALFARIRSDERGGLTAAGAMLKSVLDEDLLSRLRVDDWALDGLAWLGSEIMRDSGATILEGSTKSTLSPDWAYGSDTESFVPLGPLLWMHYDNLPSEHGHRVDRAEGPAEHWIEFSRERVVGVAALLAAYDAALIALSQTPLSSYLSGSTLLAFGELVRTEDLGFWVQRESLDPISSWTIEVRAAARVGFENGQR